MAFIDQDKPVLPLSSVASLLGINNRTLRMYGDKELLPKHEGVEKKLYSLNDLQHITYVHYLASVKKVNANGIRYILELLQEHMTPEQIQHILAAGATTLDGMATADIEEVESL